MVAIVTWLGTVLIADGMRRLGQRGPAEVLLRRLSYHPVRAYALRPTE